MGGAICAAGFLNTLMRVADFTSHFRYDGSGRVRRHLEEARPRLRRPRVLGLPHVFDGGRHDAAGRPHPGDSYDVADGNTRIPEIKAVPYLDVVAALNDKPTASRCSASTENRPIFRRV